MTEQGERPAPRGQDRPSGGRGGQRGPAGPPRGGAPSPRGGPGGPSAGSRPQPEGIRRTDPDDLRAIIVDGNAEALDREARQIAKGLANERPDLRAGAANQVRMVFADVARIRAHWTPTTDASRDVTLLKPKLAYLAGRGASRAFVDLQQILTPAIDLVDGDRARFERFAEFLDAIAAYYFSGR
ncbi:MAG: type III-A CRISPR-associated protein Csm2 [Dehalococcoidia bacterium]|nr:type III-A CRISPR-associated protein Csm2 [Dehalococcoidia bacterium]